MGKHTRTGAQSHDDRPDSLGELIHAAVRRAIEVAVDEELTTALGARPYERDGGRGGYRNGTKARTLTRPTGPLALIVPRARLFPTARRLLSARGCPTHRRDPHHARPRIDRSNFPSTPLPHRRGLGCDEAPVGRFCRGHFVRGRFIGLQKPPARAETARDARTASA